MKQKFNKINLKNILLNFGPQHPAAHGILKISLAVCGEVIIKCDPQFGLLHRGSEKLIESKNFLQSLPYFDRMDYVANLFQEHAFILAVENSFFSKFNNTNIKFWRIIFDEFSRILNHLLTMGAICLDMGSMGPIFWAFEEREQIMEFYERVSGARMHTALYKQFGFNFNLFNKLLINDILFLISRGSRYVSGSFIALLNNKSLKTRLSNIGIFSNKKLLNYGITGIIARSSGINIDIRLSSNTLSNMYNFLTFKSFLGRKSDSLDRFIIRSKEVIESFKIINQLLLFIKPFEVFKKNKFLSMESLINHFKENIFNKPLNNSLTYGLVESPKGIVMVNLVLSKSNYIYRLSLRSPVAHNMNLLPTIGNCQTFADFVATFCSLDVVLGEIDR